MRILDRLFLTLFALAIVWALAGAFSILKGVLCNTF